MANDQEAFKDFAAEVRGSYDILLSKLNVIKMSMSEAQLRSQYAQMEEPGNENAPSGEPLKLLKLVRPATPKNMRALFRAVSKDVISLREAFKTLPDETLKSKDCQQVDRIIKDLETQLATRTNELEALKTKVSETHKSARNRRGGRGKSAVKSAKRTIPASHNTEYGEDTTITVNSPMEEIGNTTVDILGDQDKGNDKSKRRVAMPPVVSTKVSRHSAGRHSGTGRHAGNNDEGQPPMALKEKTRVRERTWGAFHGQKTLSQVRPKLVLKLPAANTNTNLVSPDCDSPDSLLKTQNIDGSLVSSPRTSSITSEVSGKEPLKMRRDRTQIQETRQAARLNYVTDEDRPLFMPSPRNYRHLGGSGPPKFPKQSTNLEKVDLNRQVEGSVSPGAHVPGRADGEGQVRKPRYLTSRSRTVPDVNPATRNHLPRRGGYPFGSSFPDLPPLSSLKRGFSNVTQGSK